MDSRDSDTRRITVFADYVCPFSYLTWCGLDRAAAALGLEIAARAYELRPAPLALAAAPTPEEWAIVSEIAAETGVPMRRPTFSPRTRKAHEATKYAATVGVQDQLRRAIFAAYFAEARDIGRIDVLVEIAGGLGIERTAMKVALDVDAHTDDVARDAALAQQLEIEGTPALVAGGDVRIGYMSEDHLRDWLED